MFKHLLCASLLSVAACQLSTSAFTRHFTGGGDAPPAATPTEAAGPVPEPAYHSTYEGGPAAPAEPAPAPAYAGVTSDGTSSEPPPPMRVDLRTGERAPAGAETTCRVQGRSAMCGGVCTDVQVDDDHCGQCGDACDAGSHCDFGTCRDASGNPT